MISLKAAFNLYSIQTKTASILSFDQYLSAMLVLSA